MTPDVNALETSAEAVAKGGLPPVHLWNPPFSGDMDMCIRRDGTWVHEGGVIHRVALVKLFASILKREDGKFYLVTPVEKVGITVEDAPFVAVDVEAIGQGTAQELRFTSNLGDRVTADARNPIRVERDAKTGEPTPYVHLRAGLEALIDRKTFYRLMDLGCVEEGWFGLWSGGAFFRILPAAELDPA